MSTRQETSQPSERVLLTTGLKLCYSVYTPFSHRSHCISYFPLIHSCPLVPQGCFLIDLPYWQSAAVLIFKKKRKKRRVIYEGLSTFTPVTVGVKHLWKRCSGSGNWLSQSTFLFTKGFLNLCGAAAQGTLTWLGPSLGSPAKKPQTVAQNTMIYYELSVKDFNIDKNKK